MGQLKQLLQRFAEIGASYRADRFELDVFPEIVRESFDILGRSAIRQHYNDISRGDARKSYWVFLSKTRDTNISRPYRPSLFIDDFAEWSERWAHMVASIDTRSCTMRYTDTQRVLYTASVAFFAAIDLSERRGSRKTNGTFFEWLLGTLLVRTSNYTLTRHTPITAVSLEESKAGSGDASVPTDIVLDPGDEKCKLVFPAKISTRERIGQIFTHQRILEAKFPGRYRSALLCVSETQLMKRTHTVQETCVPTQIMLNKKYIADIDALYYLDPPFGYINDATGVPVRRISDLFACDLAAMAKVVEHVEVTDCGEVVSTLRCNLPKGHDGGHSFIPPHGTRIESARLSKDDVAD